MNPSLHSLGYGMHPADVHHYNTIQQHQPPQQQILHHEMYSPNVTGGSSINGNSANVNSNVGGLMEPASDSDDDQGHGRSTAMMFDRSLVGDRNNLKTLIMRAVFENQIHLQTRKGDAFDNLAQTLGQREEFKPYRLHGRKLQKSFNKIARDIKDCIIQENEPSRWGKEEPEFFQIARKIFEEARRAGIRAFDEKLKSKTITDRLLNDPGMDLDDPAKKKRKREQSLIGNTGGFVGGGYGMSGVSNLSQYHPHAAHIQQQQQQQQQQQLNHQYSSIPLPQGYGVQQIPNPGQSNQPPQSTVQPPPSQQQQQQQQQQQPPPAHHNHGGHHNNLAAENAAGEAASAGGGKYLQPLVAGEVVPANVSEFMRLNPEFMRLIEDFINARFVELQQCQIRLHSHEIEASLGPSLDRFKSYDLHTVQQLLDRSGISDYAKAKIYEHTSFHVSDDSKLFLIYYCDIMMRSAQAILNIQNALGLSVQDATTLYNFIDHIAAAPPAAAAVTVVGAAAGTTTTVTTGAAVVPMTANNNNNNNNNTHAASSLPVHDESMGNNVVNMVTVNDAINTLNSSSNNNNNNNTNDDNSNSNNNNNLNMVNVTASVNSTNSSDDHNSNDITNNMVSHHHDAAVSINPGVVMMSDRLVPLPLPH